MGAKDFVVYSYISEYADRDTKFGSMPSSFYLECVCYLKVEDDLEI